MDKLRKLILISIHKLVNYNFSKFRSTINKSMDKDSLQ